MKALQSCTVLVHKRVDGDTSVQSAVISKLIGLGASCAKRLSKDITHVVFLRKLLPTAAEQTQQTLALRDLHDRLAKVSPDALIVSNLWVHASAEQGCRADEKEYLILRPEDPPALGILSTLTPEGTSKGRRRSGLTPKRPDLKAAPLPGSTFSFDVGGTQFSSSQQLSKQEAGEEPPSNEFQPSRNNRKRRASAPEDYSAHRRTKRQEGPNPGIELSPLVPCSPLQCPKHQKTPRTGNRPAAQTTPKPLPLSPVLDVSVSLRKEATGTGQNDHPTPGLNNANGCINTTTVKHAGGRRGVAWADNLTPQASPCRGLMLPSTAGSNQGTPSAATTPARSAAGTPSSDNEHSAQPARTQVVNKTPCRLALTLSDHGNKTCTAAQVLAPSSSQLAGGNATTMTHNISGHNTHGEPVQTLNAQSGEPLSLAARLMLSRRCTSTNGVPANSPRTPRLLKPTPDNAALQQTSSPATMLCTPWADATCDDGAKSPSVIPSSVISDCVVANTVGRVSEQKQHNRSADGTDCHRDTPASIPANEASDSRRKHSRYVTGGGPCKEHISAGQSNINTSKLPKQATIQQPCQTNQPSTSHPNSQDLHQTMQGGDGSAHANGGATQVGTANNTSLVQTFDDGTMTLMPDVSDLMESQTLPVLSGGNNKTASAAVSTMTKMAAKPFVFKAEARTKTMLHSGKRVSAPQGVIYKQTKLCIPRLALNTETTQAFSKPLTTLPLSGLANGRIGST